ncbi:predicted protein [Sclerotinia sclerotiorum 1980 UF-70]|uniref:Uncharacterized protein n=2 Tax=Sclerotinia sclerotiorum (strain ATCC 18683 / 1980 / Ss-1) TaxID=665079 RepID=A7ENJ7_SCLS1|nr:predicted protein [Sclerotinia sclerotiorum 1980 UF-70]APA14845.1 hypothetical protein sscle_13g096150 [Sclerotinia sclerotiorum 1980 UF-70]EDO04413.1 predicted protein [Sclerotinia sclerotiorum 1980 UF-70]
MSLLNCIRGNFKARAERKRQAIDDFNKHEDEETSSESFAKQNPVLLDEATSSGERTSEENFTCTTRKSTHRTSNFAFRATEESPTSTSTSTSTTTTTNRRTISSRSSQATTLRGPALHNDLNEDLDSEDVGGNDSSTAPPSPVSRNHDRSSMSSHPSITLQSSHQANGLHRQWLNNRRRINHRLLPENNNYLSVEHHQDFGAPLERVNARQPHPSLSTGVQDQVGNQMDRGPEHPYFDFKTENPDLEDAWANSDRAQTDYLELLFGSPQAPL